MNWWEILLSVLGGLILVYAVLLVLLAVHARRHPETVGLKEALRLLPDLLVLLRRLIADPATPGGVRLRLVGLLVYLAMPIDLVPDFIPVIGYADDAVVVALVLRSVIRHSGTQALQRQWPGSPAGLELILKLAGVNSSAR